MYTPMASTPQMTPWATEPGKAFSSDVKFMEPPQMIKMKIHWFSKEIQRYYSKKTQPGKAPSRVFFSFAKAIAPHSPMATRSSGIGQESRSAISLLYFIVTSSAYAMGVVAGSAPFTRIS